jgi:hypothetical protein
VTREAAAETEGDRLLVELYCYLLHPNAEY